MKGIGIMMNNAPLISVIVPIYNVEKYLDNCMETLVNQTYANLEIIMVDDGSPDNCPAICESWAKKDPRVKVIHKENGGLGFARNSGLEKATGKYVAFIDSDDYVDRTMIEKLYNALGDSDTVYCGLNRVYPDGTVNPAESLYDGRTFVGDEIVDNILLRMMGDKPERDRDCYFYMSVWHALYSMEIIEKYHIRFLSERQFMSEDIAFHIDYLARSQKATCIGDHLYYYRVNYNSLSVRVDPKRFDRIKDMHLKLRVKLGGYFDEERYAVIERGWFLSLTRGQIVGIVNRKEKHPIRKIGKITSDPMVIAEIKQYPYQKNPKSRRLFNTLVAKRLNLLIYILLKLK